MPANAKLHGAELGYILAHSGARACFATAGLDDEIAPHAPKSLERLITIGGREYQELLTTSPARARAARRRRSRLAVLHLRHHRPAEGRDAHAPGSLGREPCLRDRGRPGCAGRCHPARGADEPWLRPLHHGARGPPRRQRRAGVGRFRARGSVPSDRRLAARLDVRGSDHDQAPGRVPGRLPRPPTSARSYGAARRCMSRMR